MIYKEEQGDLFELHPNYWLCQCISADFGMGAGIAVEFNRRFDEKNVLLNNFSSTGGIDMWNSSINKGYVIGDPKNQVLNLVTKVHYWNKPIYLTLINSLKALKDYVEHNNITKLAMPKIGCGLDKLDWSKVRDIIKDIFKDTDIEITVRYL